MSEEPNLVRLAFSWPQTNVNERIGSSPWMLSGRFDERIFAGRLAYTLERHVVLTYWMKNQGMAL